jgi:hypothetical protein
MSGTRQHMMPPWPRGQRDESRKVGPDASRGDTVGTLVELGSFDEIKTFNTPQDGFSVRAEFSLCAHSALAPPR